MQISLRSHMIAGVAALGATAIAITPITQPDLLPSAQRAAASIELSSFDSPFTAISQVVEDINTNILSNAEFGAPWTTDPAFPLLYLGIIPDFLDLPLPALTTVGTNLSGYGWAGVRGVGDLSAKVLQAAWNTPLAVIDAVQLLFQGKTQEAIDLLKAEIVAPLQLGINSLLNSGDYILSNVVENIGIVAAGIVPAVQNLLGVTLNGAAYIGAAAIKTVQDSVDALTQGEYDKAWNIAVAGFLGREGTFGLPREADVGARHHHHRRCHSELPDGCEQHRAVVPVQPAVRPGRGSVPAGQRCGEGFLEAGGGVGCGDTQGVLAGR